MIFSLAISTELSFTTALVVQSTESFLQVRHRIQMLLTDLETFLTRVTCSKKKNVCVLFVL